MRILRDLIVKAIQKAASVKRRTTLFDVSWRLAVLSLPWQTRWYREASLAGWPWEQGSWAVYVSWALLAAAIVFGSLGLKREDSSVKALTRTDKALLWTAGIILAVSFLVSDSYAASAQWLMEAGLLVVFVFTLLRQRVPARSLAVWFVVSLIPQACLAYWQYAVQRVDAIKWLGVAFQSPKQLGVSVVEFADLRFLRAYGGMPHPNILGGWLAVGVLAAWHGAWRAPHKRAAFLWSAASAVLGGALVLTFSRTAFLALAVGCAALAGVFFLQRKDERNSAQFGILAMVVALAFSGVLAFTQREVLLARADQGNRLVVQSSDARLQSYADGWQVLKDRPFFGGGPNAELASLARVKFNTEIKRLRQPLESPHNAFMLLAVDLGLLGAGIFLWVAWRFRRALLRRWWILPPVLVLASLDHYLWSYWSGLALLSVVSALVLGPEPDA